MLQEPMTLPIGAVIPGLHGERYIVEGLLGQGGFSAVYRVRERHARENILALKEVINPAFHERRRLTYEAELLMRLEHRSLPHVYQVFENVKLNRIYMLMDYVEGKNLESLRQEQPEKRFSLTFALSLLTPIVDALSYLHCQSPPVIHRDIKPANIIVPTGNGEPYLVDFGLAKEYIEDKTTNVFRYGTPGYAALEQYGQGTNQRTDVYGLGATLYTLLTGKLPPDALSRAVGKNGKDPLLAVDQLNPAIPPAITEVIGQAMRLSNDDRFNSVEEFWQALSVATVQKSGSAPKLPNTPLPPTALPEQEEEETLDDLHQQQHAENKVPTSRKRTSRGVLFTVTLLLLIALITGGSLFYTFWYQHAQQPAIGHITHTHQITKPKSTPTPLSPYPQLTTGYGGVIDDVTVAKEHTNMFLSEIKQDQDKISGRFQGLGHSGPFTGNVTKDGTITFTVNLPSLNETLSFQGVIKVGGDLKGVFDTLNANGQSTGETGSWYLSAPK